VQKKHNLIVENVNDLLNDADCCEDSNSLGRRKLSDNKLVPALLGFVCEGIRFAFSYNEDDEEVFL